MRRHSRHHYRFGDPEVGADLAPIAPAAPSLPARSGGGLLTPKTGNLLVGAGLLTALGVVGYYVYKGGSLTDLWSRLTASAAEPSAGEGGAIAAPKLCTVTLPSGATVSRPCNALQATGPMATYTPPSSIANYIPQGLPSGRGGGGAGGVYRPAMDVY